MRRLNQGSFVRLYFSLFALSELFSCTVLFVSIGQVIGCEDRVRNDPEYAGWGHQTLLPVPSSPDFFLNSRHFVNNAACLKNAESMDMNYFTGTNVAATIIICGEGRPTVSWRVW